MDMRQTQNRRKEGRALLERMTGVLRCWLVPNVRLGARRLRAFLGLCGSKKVFVHSGILKVLGGGLASGFVQASLPSGHGRLKRDMHSEAESRCACASGARILAPAAFSPCLPNPSYTSQVCASHLQSLSLRRLRQEAEGNGLRRVSRAGGVLRMAFR